MPDMELSYLECEVPGRRDQSAVLSPIPYLLTGSPIQINAGLPLFLLFYMYIYIYIYIFFFLLTFAWMSQVSILLHRVFVGSSSSGESSVMNSLYHSGITTCSFPKPSGYMKWNDPSRKPRMVILMQERKRRSKRGSDLGTHTGLE